MRVVITIAAVLGMAVSSFGTIANIDSVVAGTAGSPPFMLESITVGSYTVNVESLVVGNTDAEPGGNEGGDFFDTWPPPFEDPAPCSNFDINDILARNNNPNVVTVTAFGAGNNWYDVNGDNPDFFIFEAASGSFGDTDVSVQAILPGGALGQAVDLGDTGTWGDTGLDRVTNPNGGQNLTGVSFAIEDLLDGSGTPLTQASQIYGLQINSSGIDPSLVAALEAPSSLNQITDFEVAGGDAIITWDAAGGYAYNVMTSSNLADAGALHVLPPFTNLPGVSGSMTATTVIDTAASDAYYGVEHDVVPVFFDDLESGAPGWGSTTLVGSTDWELGMPDYTNSRGSFVTARSGSNAWATGLTIPYVTNDNAVLRTPVIDLTGLSFAVLSFNQVTDLEDTFDFGYVNILDSSSSVLTTQLHQANGTSDTWTQQNVDLTAFTNQQIIIEFELAADGVDFEFDWYGWAIDDVWVGVVAPPPPPPPPPPPNTNSVTDLILVTSGSNSVDLATLTEGGTYDLDALGAVYSNVNVRAEADGAVGSITFALTGATTHNQTESVGPYYLYGDSGAGAFIQNGTLSNGVHNLVATPWSSGGGAGQAGTNLTVNFTILTTY